MSKVKFELADGFNVFEMAFGPELVRIEAGETFEADDRAMIHALDAQPAVRRVEGRKAAQKAED